MAHHRTAVWLRRRVRGVVLRGPVVGERRDPRRAVRTVGAVAVGALGIVLLVLAVVALLAPTTVRFSYPAAPLDGGPVAPYRELSCPSVLDEWRGADDCDEVVSGGVGADPTWVVIPAVAGAFALLVAGWLFRRGRTPAQATDVASTSENPASVDPCT